MRVLVTGADYVWGYLTAEAVLATPALKNSAGVAEPIESVVLVVHDRPWDPAIERDARLKWVKGDIAKRAEIEAIIADHRIGSIMHFETVTRDYGPGEDDFWGMMRVNALGTLNILESCRAMGNRPKLVFCSSSSVFEDGIRETVSEQTRRMPTSTYGTTKAIAELLINNYAERGYVDGRSAILPMCVSWRPYRRNAEFLHEVLDQPLNGKEIRLALRADTRLYFNGYLTCIRNLIELHEIDGQALGRDRSMLQPGIAHTITEMIDAFRRTATRKNLKIGPVVNAFDAEKQAEFDVYNKDANTQRARQFKLSTESLDSIVQRYCDDYLALPPESAA
jgi:nucleoside-diphosphate-sugar epimerase